MGKRLLPRIIKKSSELIWWCYSGKNSLYREPNVAGGHRWWSDEVGGGVIVWDTSLVAAETLKAVLEVETEAQMHDMKKVIVEEQPERSIDFNNPLRSASLRADVYETVNARPGDGDIPITLNMVDIWNYITTDMLHREIASREVLDGSENTPPEVAVAQISHMRKLVAQAVQDLRDVTSKAMLLSDHDVNSLDGIDTIDEVISLFDHVLDPIAHEHIPTTRYEREIMDKQIAGLAAMVELNRGLEIENKDLRHANRGLAERLVTGATMPRLSEEEVRNRVRADEMSPDVLRVALALARKQIGELQDEVVKLKTHNGNLKDDYDAMKARVRAEWDKDKQDDLDALKAAQEEGD